MLRRLVINNVALIEKAEMEFSDGLNILTGETGSGKTVIIDSINAITGRRTDREMIRTGEDRASIEALFETGDRISEKLKELAGIDPEPDGTIIISREFAASGKNVCRINGRLATISMLRQLGECLLDMHGQHDNQSLLRTGTHLDLLDSYGGKGIAALKQEYSELYHSYCRIKEKLDSLKNSSMERARREDLYRYQAEEIKKAGLKSGEEEELRDRKSLIVNSEKIMNGLSTAYELLEGDGSAQAHDAALEKIGSALTALASAAQFDGRNSDTLEKLQDVYYQLEEIAAAIRETRDSTDFEPGSLEIVDDRLDLIYGLKRKYGATIEEINVYYEKVTAELKELQDDSEAIETLEAEYARTGTALYSTACRLNGLRGEAAAKLKDKVMAELEDLEMKKSLFEVSIEFHGVNAEQGNVETGISECDYSPDGLDRIEFLISPNPGEPLKPLSKIASGGEMSRIMLAIKTILAESDAIPTLVFDEIDAGVSGKAAMKVAEKLALVSCTHQIICVTHLAQIACMADRHFVIRKAVVGAATRTMTELLDRQGVEREIATILGGDRLSKATHAHTCELLANAERYKRETRYKCETATARESSA